MAMEVKRIDYPEQKFRLPSGGHQINPAHFTLSFISQGREIAIYDSKDDVLYLRSEYIDSRSIEVMQRPYSERIELSPYKAEYLSLLAQYSKVSEFTSM